MLLKSLLESVIQTELANLSIGKPEWATGQFSYKTLIEGVSLGYIELHKRFALQKEFVRVVPILGRTKYPLEMQYAVSDATPSVDKFIIDSVGDPFKDNIAKIDTVLDKQGEPLKFNTTTFKDLVSISDYKTLYIPDPICTPELTLVCRGLPAPIVLASENDLETYEIELPYTYLEALICYTAGRAYVNRGAENATNNESAIFMARFEAACMTVVQLGLNDKEEMVNDRLCRGGFV